MKTSKVALRRALVLAVGALSWAGVPQVMAADHGDAPTVVQDQGADIADVYFYLDPNDNSRVVLAATVHGFIAAGENANFGIFDPNVKYRFQIENTGDAKPDTYIEVMFSPRVTKSEAQTATIKLPDGTTFTAPATNATDAETAPPFVVTDNPAAGGVKFFAGLVDDPFFFDIPAFDRFSASVRAGSPDVSQFNRGRDSFAGYNVLGIAISLPKTALLDPKGKGPTDVVGLNFVTQRGTQKIEPTGEFKRTGAWKTVDRMGLPAINVVLLPFAKKNLYNGGTTVDDAKQKFAPDIISTAQGLGMTIPNIQNFAKIAVNNGDFLRLNLNTPNTGPGGGNNSEAVFPNGRRLNDDTVDILLTLINNGSPLGDNVNTNGGTTDTFPFFHLPNQPQPAGVVDDGTRN